MTSRENRVATTASITTLACVASILGPESASAQTIVVSNDLQGATVGFLTGRSASLSLPLPGGAGLQFSRVNSTTQFIKASGLGGALFGRQNNSRTGVSGVDVAFRTAANPALNWHSNNAQRTNAGAALNIIAGRWMMGELVQTVNAGYAYTYAFDFSRGPADFTNKFLLFTFVENTTTKYGWVEILSAGSEGERNDGGLFVQFGRVAYNTTGATIAPGEIAPVPEPESAGLAMGGALVVGAAGLRRWRRHQEAKAKAVAV